VDTQRALAAASIADLTPFRKQVYRIVIDAGGMRGHPTRTRGRLDRRTYLGCVDEPDNQDVRVACGFGNVLNSTIPRRLDGLRQTAGQLTPEHLGDCDFHVIPGC
jgi:hypothetical protein